VQTCNVDAIERAVLQTTLDRVLLHQEIARSDFSFDTQKNFKYNDDVEFRYADMTKEILRFSKFCTCQQKPKKTDVKELDEDWGRRTIYRSLFGGN